jgi:mitochondrial import receptor subunit TOM70
LQAAETFTEALNYLSKNGSSLSTDLDTSVVMKSTSTSTDITVGGNLLRQQVTLLNNRSAMYEKAEIYDLAVDDCVQILELEVTHTKARLRKLRIHEVLKEYHDALIEICAIQLLFMQMNRVNLQRNLPVPPPPIPQSKMEEVLNELLPSETEKYVTLLNERNTGINSQQPLPGHYTILQLLRSYTEYNAWMAMAAKDGSVEMITNKLKDLTSLSINDQALLYYQRGRRYVYDRKYEEASNDFEQALVLVHNKPIIIAAMKDDTYARILEWTGMVRHWHYKLDDALSCLQEASKIEPTNALLIVKQAGIQLDAGKQDEAIQLFDQALKVDPNSVDALLHRSNLRIMQNNPELAKKDLEKCIQLRPSHTMARLRLASILVPMEDMDGAKRQIELAEQSEPNSSEVHSYRGELHFAQGEMDDARIAFEKAIQLEPFNPTPYVNAAMAVINTVPSPGQMPDTGKVVKLLEQAIEVDPQFSAAYVHLGQLKLGTATNLAQAREVVELYDIALTKCRTPEEVKELCGMRILAVAQVEAAEQLKIDNFNLLS